MSFTMKVYSGDMATEMFMEKFNMKRFEKEDMQRDIAIIARWCYEKTYKMTADDKRLFCLNFMNVMQSGVLYMTLLTCFKLHILKIDDIKLLNLNFDTGVAKDLMKYLKCKLSNWQPTAKYINLVLAEMPLKMGLQYEETTDKVVGFQDIDGVRSSNFASKALLIAAQGTVDIFFQSLGYAFLSEKDSSEELISWIKRIIQQLENSGYTVCSVISQQTPVFQKLVDRLGITPQKPYFEVDGKKVFYMFDPGYLLIAVRDLLLNSNLFYDSDKLISWSDIVDIHKLFKVLTEAHINPAPAHEINTNKERKTQKKLASEVFNLVVCELITAKYAPEESCTASFVRTMFNVFKIITGDMQGPLPVYYGTEQQVKAFKKAVTMTQRIKLPDMETQNEIPCFSGLQITLNAVMQLQKYSKPKEMKTVFMTMFEIEQMLIYQENIRESIRRTSFTPIQFKYGFSKAMLNDLIRNSTNDAGCSYIGPISGPGSYQQPSGELFGQDLGQREHDRLMECIRSGTFECLFKDHLLRSTTGKQKRKHIPT